jgi:hypothetical protein
MGRGIRTTLLAVVGVAAASACLSGTASAAITLPLADKCLEPQTPPTGLTQVSSNVEDLGTIIGEAGALNAGGKLVGHYFYVTGSTHFSIYDVADPAQPKLVSRTDFPCRFENEDVTVTDNLLIYSDFATTGDLYVYDVRDKAHPKLIADTPGAGTHTMECIDGCRYLYGSYHAVGSAGPLTTGEVVDLSDPAAPKVLGDWTDNGVLPSRKVHDVNEVQHGRLITASAPMEYLDTTVNRVKPKVLAVSDTPADHRFHTAIWPRAGEDKFVLTSYETNGTPRCEAGAGEFAVFDATQWPTTGKFKRLHTWTPVNGQFTDGNPPAETGLGCSPHWFNVRPSWNDGGVVAMAAYDNGTHFLRVASDGSVSDVGYYLAPGTNASGAYWITCDIVYVVDYTRGIDILRFKDAASACTDPNAGSQLVTAPSQGSPAAAAPPSVKPRCASRRSFRIRLSLPHGVKRRSVRAVTVRVNGRRVGVRRGRRLTAPVDLRGLPAGKVAVTIRYRLKGGGVKLEKRRYQTCARRR